MSILIKGMEMPFSCLACPCSGTNNTDDGNEVWVCEASELRRLTVEDKIVRRPEWCPLVPVPYHGDLIDVEVQMQLMQACEYDTYDDYKRAFDMLDNAPTIIPVERSD